MDMKNILLLTIFAAIFCLQTLNAQVQIGADINGENAGDQSGLRISMPDSRTIAIGGNKNGGNGIDAGHVRIFEWTGSIWQQKGLDIDGEAAGDNSGFYVSMPDSQTVAIGAIYNDGTGNDAGHVRIYEWTGSVWQQKGADIDGEAAADLSGFGLSMPDAQTVAIGGSRNDGNGNLAGHVRIYEWSGTAWQQKGSDIDGEAASDESGFSVSMPDAQTVAIGALVNDGNGINSGHVRIYEWTGTAWQQKGIDIDGEASDDQSGYSVSMPDAQTVAIGARFNDGNGSNAGHVRVYEWIGTAWQQKGSDIDGETSDDQSGFSISMPDAQTLAIGARNNDGSGINSGHVRIYQWDGSAWQQFGIDIDGEASDDESGYFVSMPDARTVAIGAPFNDGNGANSGHVRVYSLDPIANAVQIGADIDGEAANDQSGYSVSMPDAQTLAVGARFNDVGGSQTGHVRVHEWNGSTWQQKGNDIDGEGIDDESGFSVSMPDNQSIAIGARYNDGIGIDAGHVRIFDWNGSAWQQRGSDIEGEAAGDQAGYSVSMPNPQTVAIGSPNNDGNGSNAGHVRIFEWTGSVWQQKGLDIDGEAAGDEAGYRVSMPDPQTVAIGARKNDGNGNDAGHVRIYEWTGSAWQQKGMDIDGEAAGDEAGFYVSMPDNQTVAIGAPFNDGNGADAGHVRIYEWTGSAWQQKGADIDGETAGDFSGFGIHMPDAQTIAIGGSRNDGNGNLAGHVRIYEWSGGIWQQKVLDIDGEAAGDESGFSVAMPNTNTVAIGALVNDGNGVNSGHVRIYSICSSDVTSISPSACGSYVSPSGKIFTTSGVYMDTIQNARGCDSIIMIDLTINTVDASVTLSNATLTANTAGASYQWIDCDNGNAAISGATGQSFTATQSGNYAVIVTENNCSDTSACTAVVVTDLNTDSNFSKIVLYPNPAFDQISIESETEISSVQIYDLAGLHVLTSNKSTITISSLEKGVYMVRVITKSRENIMPLVKH